VDVFPISIANLSFLPLAMRPGAPRLAADMAHKPLPVRAGNIDGGSVLVALMYWVIYLRARSAVRNTKELR
jgi:formate/nitrite transporter FocA (FNT family)